MSTRICSGIAALSPGSSGAAPRRGTAQMFRLHRELDAVPVCLGDPRLSKDVRHELGTNLLVVFVRNALLTSAEDHELMLPA